MRLDEAAGVLIRPIRPVRTPPEFPGGAGLRGTDRDTGKRSRWRWMGMRWCRPRRARGGARCLERAGRLMQHGAARGFSCRASGQRAAMPRRMGQRGTQQEAWRRLGARQHRTADPGRPGMMWPERPARRKRRRSRRCYRDFASRALDDTEPDDRMADRMGDSPEAGPSPRPGLLSEIAAQLGDMQPGRAAGGAAGGPGGWGGAADRHRHRRADAANAAPAAAAGREAGPAGAGLRLRPPGA